MGRIRAHTLEHLIHIPPQLLVRNDWSRRDPPIILGKGVAKVPSDASPDALPPIGRIDAALLGREVVILLFEIDRSKANDRYSVLRGHRIS